MKIGAHISAAGDLANAPLNAHKENLECFQFFSRSPQGGKVRLLTDADVDNFLATCKKHKLTDYYIHAPYYINFASADNRIYYGSISAIREELERGCRLKAKYVMTHLGSAKELARPEAIKKVIVGLKAVVKNYKGTTKLLIENSAGSGNVVGDTFDELGGILKGLNANEQKYIPGVCLDLMHSFASGYDWRTKKTIDESLKKFDKEISLKKLLLIHSNDSKVAFNSRVDRHEHIGYGQIVETGFKLLAKNKCLSKVNWIVEVEPEGREEDIKKLKKWR
jgi:deoxyribonuclease-4